MAFMPWKNKQTENDPSAPSMATLRSEIDRLLDTFIREPFGLDWSFGQRGLTPPIDLAETTKEVFVRTEIPGVDPNDLEVTFSGGQLVLAGEKKDLAQTSGRDFHHVESRFGRFRRVIPLNQPVDPDRVEAEYANGVLTIRLQKVATAAPKRINVKTPSSEASHAESPMAVPPATDSGHTEG